jgi:hypothetical protein
MSTFQTLLAVVTLIFALCIVVQAVQELIKSALNTKATTMEASLVTFMGNHLTLQQIKDALQTRGLDVTALEHFDKDDFRHLLDGVDFSKQPLAGIVADSAATLAQKKDNIAAAYEGLRASFQRAYAAKNKTIAVFISLSAVLALNANVLMMYEELATDQAMTQAIAGQATTIITSQQTASAGGGSLESSYQSTRKTISDIVAKYPPIVRDSAYKTDFSERLPTAIAGLLLMAFLVSLGAPFWNDVLKGMTGVNDVLNTNMKRSST